MACDPKQNSAENGQSTDPCFLVSSNYTNGLQGKKSLNTRWGGSSTDLNTDLSTDSSTDLNTDLSNNQERGASFCVSATSKNNGSPNPDSSTDLNTDLNTDSNTDSNTELLRTLEEKRNNTIIAAAPRDANSVPLALGEGKKTITPHQEASACATRTGRALPEVIRLVTGRTTSYGEEGLMALKEFFLLNDNWYPVHVYLVSIKGMLAAAQNKSPGRGMVDPYWWCRRYAARPAQMVTPTDREQKTARLQSKASAKSHAPVTNAKTSLRGSYAGCQVSPVATGL